MIWSGMVVQNSIFLVLFPHPLTRALAACLLVWAVLGLIGALRAQSRARRAEKLDWTIYLLEGAFRVNPDPDIGADLERLRSRRDTYGERR